MLTESPEQRFRSVRAQPHGECIARVIGRQNRRPPPLGTLVDQGENHPLKRIRQFVFEYVIQKQEVRFNESLNPNCAR